MIVRILRCFLPFVIFLHFSRSFANDSIPLKASPSGSKRFTFEIDNVAGKETYRMVSIPYASQPVYVNFFATDFRSPNDVVETKLYEDQTLTKLLGSVIIKYDGISFQSTFKSADGKETPFVPDFYIGKCSAGDSFSAFHSVHEVKDRLARIGEGPWGKQAWVNTRLVEFDRLDLKYQYNGESVSDYVMVRWDNYVQLQPYNPEFKQYFSYYMPVTTLLQGLPHHIDFKIACNNPFSGQFADEPMVVDLVPGDFAPYGENFPRAHNKTVMGEAFACKLINEHYWDMSYQKVNLTIDKSVDAIFLTYADSKHMNYPNKISESQFYFSNVRPNSSPNFFTITEGQNIKVSIFKSDLLDEKMESTNINLKSADKFIRHKFVPSVIPKDSIVKIFVSNFELGQLSTSKPLEIDFSPGEYPLKIRTISLNDESTEDYFNITVSADQTGEKTINLKDVRMQKHFYLSYNDKAGTISTHDNVLVQSVERFSYVKDSVINLTSFLVPKTIVVNRPEELKQMIKRGDAGSIIVEGTCLRTEPKPSFHSIPIHSSSSDASEVLGALKLKSNDYDVGVSVTFIRQDGYTTKFKPNYFQQGCERSNKVLLLHQVNQTKGDWSDLGKGPWGNSGWINVAAKPLFANDFVFEVDGVGYGRLEKKSKDLYVFTPEPYYGSEEDPKPKDVPKSNLINKNGTVKPKIICELGC